MCHKSRRILKFWKYDIDKFLVGHSTRPRFTLDSPSSFSQAKDSFLIVRDSLLNLEKQATDTVSSMQSSGVVGGGDDNSSMLLLTALAVLAALALCVTLALTYRRRLSHA